MANYGPRAYQELRHYVSWQAAKVYELVDRYTAVRENIREITGNYIHPLSVPIRLGVSTSQGTAWNNRATCPMELQIMITSVRLMLLNAK